MGSTRLILVEIKKMNDESPLNENKMLWIQCYCWFYDLLSNKQRKKFVALLNKFIGEMKFVGIGIEITDEIKIAVGGWAVLLVLNRPLGTNWYRHIERVSIYPGGTLKSENVLGLLADGGHYCQIHLAWEDVRNSATKATDNRNTILHEFAHALDHINRKVNGHPSMLLSEEELAKWKNIFCPEFIHSRTNKQREKLWKYFGLGAWNDFDPDDSSCVDVAELFAISTEMFYESPLELQKITPEIYDCLMSLYRFNAAVEIPKKQKITIIRDALSTALNRLKWT